MSHDSKHRIRKPHKPREIYKEIFTIYGLLLAALIWNWW